MTLRVLICGGGPLHNPDPDCPNAEAHTPAPTGYNAWHSWATRMSRTHRQTRCPGCRLYHIWVPYRIPSRPARRTR